jgi:hypothetical protein
MAGNGAGAPSSRSGGSPSEEHEREIDPALVASLDELLSTICQRLGVDTAGVNGERTTPVRVLPPVRRGPPPLPLASAAPTRASRRPPPLPFEHDECDESQATLRPLTVAQSGASLRAEVEPRAERAPVEPRRRGGAAVVAASFAALVASLVWTFAPALPTASVLAASVGPSHGLDATFAARPRDHVDLGTVVVAPERQRVVIDGSPPHAYVMVSNEGSYDGPRFAGPWPREITLAPGSYQVVAFRAGYTTQIRKLVVEAGAGPSGLRFALTPQRRRR